MGRMNVIGGFEELVLMSVSRLGEEAYGVPIRKRVEEATGRSVSVGALYTTLDRLEEKGFISSRQSEPIAVRGGRARRYFKVEGAGYAALEEAQRIREHMTDGMAPGFSQPVRGVA